MSKRDWKLFAEDILESLELIESYVQNMDFAEFTKNRKTIDAVVRNLEIIGEASKNTPEDQEELWQHGLEGNGRAEKEGAHEYFGVSLHIVWNQVQQELPGLKREIRQLLEDARR